MRAFANSRQYKWLPWLIIGMAVGMVTVVALALHYVESRLVASKGESLALAAAEIADKLDLLLVEQYDSTLELSRTQVFRKDGVAAQSAYLTTVKKTNPIYLWLGVTDAGGRIVAATDSASVEQNRSRSSWFQAARGTDGVHISAAEPFEETGGTDAISFTTSIKGADGKFQGTVTTRVGLPALEEVLTRTIHAFRTQGKFAGSIEYQFMNDKGWAFIDSDLMHKGNVNLKQLGLPSALISESGQPGYVEELHKRRRVSVITGYAQTREFGQFPDLKWTILLRIDQSDLLAPIRKVLWTLGTLSLLIGGPLFIMLVWSTTRLKEEWALTQEEHAHAVAAEAKYRLLVNQAKDIIYRTDDQGRFTFVNPIVTRIMGYSPQELLGRRFTELIRPDTCAATERFYGWQFVRKTPSTYYEFPALAKDGREIWIGQNVQVLLENGQVTGFHAVARDITERTRMETALRDRETQMRLFMEATADCIWNWDLGADCITRNAGFERLFGYAAEEIVPTINWWAERLHPDDRERVWAIYQDTVSSGRTTCSFEYRFRRRDGSYAVITDHAFIVRDGTGKVVRALGAMTDITERKRAEEALHQSREQLQAIWQNSSAIMFIKDRQGRYLDIGPQFSKLTSLSREQILGKTDADIFPPEQAALFRANDLKVLEADRSMEFEEVAKHEDGPRTSIVYKFPLHDSHGRLFAIGGIVTDITERKQAEEALRANEQRMRAILDGALDAVVGMDERGVITDWNPRAETIFGWARSEAIGQNLAETIIPPRYREQHHHGMRNFLTTGEGPLLNRRVEISALRRDGTEFPVELTVSYSIQDDSRRFTAFIADITERKRAEKERKAMALRNAALVNALGQIVYDWKPSTNELIWGGNYTDVLGYSPEDIGTTTESWTRRVHPDDLKKVLREVERATDEHRNYDLEYRFLHRDGSYRWMHDRGVLTITPNGKLERIIGVFFDITERKQAEEALRESERRFRTIFDQAPLGMAVINSASGQFRRINRKFCEIVGYPHKEMLARTFQDITHPDDLQADLDNMARMMEGRIHNFQMEKRYIRKDGAIVWVNLMCVPLWWDYETDGRFHIAMVKDITERKQAEQDQKRLLAEVAQSRNHFEAIFRSTPSAIAITTLKDGRFIEVNESAACLTGYSREEMLGRTSVELGLWVDPDERPDFVRKLVENGQLLNWERQVRTKQGEVRDAIFCFEQIQVGDEPCLISIAHDITERKRAEAALRERSRQQTIEAELSLLAVTVPDLPSLLNAVIKLVADVLGTEHCEVLQLLPNGKELLLRAGQGWKEGLVGHATTGTGLTSQAGYTLLSNVPVVVENFRTETRFNVHPLLHDHGIVSGMSFIIHGRDEPWGILGAYATRQRSFSRDDVAFFRTVSNILATAIERMQTEDVLRSANQTLRTLSRQLLQVQEEDRRTIARDLHDEIGQSLTAIKLNVERAQRTPDRIARDSIMKDCVQITDSVLNQVRNLSLDLHPSILDDLGLSYALKWYADRQAERAGLKVEVTADPSGSRLPQDVEIACFRIAQEALTNVVRHAQASRASITLKRLAKRVELRIQDDGIGFDVRTAQSSTGVGTNIGLTGMRERARLVGGEVHVKSVSKKGTEVTAIVPLPSVLPADSATPQAPLA